MGKNQWIVPREKGWAVHGEGNSKDTSHHRTQKEAIDAGRRIAQNQGSELIIQGQGGKIRARDSHGHDPNPPKG